MLPNLLLAPPLVLLSLLLTLASLVTVVLLATRRRRSGADLEARLEAARRETDDLRQRLDELTRPVVAEPDHADFVITHVGEPGLGGPDASGDAVAVPDEEKWKAEIADLLIY